MAPPLQRLGKKGRQLLAVLLGVVLLVLLAGALAWSFAKPLAQWGLSRALGHPVSITGRFQPYLLPAPGFSAAGLRVAAPRRCTHRDMLSIERLSVQADGSALLRGSLVVDQLALDAPHLVVERCAGGRLNWSDGAAQTGRPSLRSALSSLSELPEVRHLVLGGGRILYAGSAPEDLRGSIASLEWRQAPSGRGGLRAEGSLAGRPWDIALTLQRQGTAVWRLSGLVGDYGKATLHGAVRLDAAGARPSVVADVRLAGGAGAVADLTHLWTRMRALGRDEAERDAELAWLRGFDARVAATAGPARIAGVQLQELRLQLALEQGVLTLDPLLVRSAEGALRASLRLDVNTASPQGRITLASEHFPLALLPGAGLDGYLQGRAVLAFAGARIEEAAASLRYRSGADRPSASDVRIALQAEHGGTFPVHLTAQGRLHGAPLKLDAHANPLMLLGRAAAARPAPFKFEGRLGAARLAVQGSLGPAGALELERARLAAGRSSMRVSAMVDDIIRPRRVELHARAGLLRQADLDKLASTLERFTPEPAQRGGWTERLGRLDARVDVAAERVVLDALPALREVALQARLREGRFDLNRLHASIGRGTLVAEGHLAGIGERLRGELQARIHNVRPGPLLAALGVERRFPGVLKGRVSLALGELGTGSRLSVLRYRAPSMGTRVTLRLRQTAQAIQLDLQGRYRKEAFELHARGGPPPALSGPGAYPFTLRFTALATRGTLAGTIREPLRLDGLQARLTLAGPSPRRIEPVVGFRLPELPPYRLAGPLSKQGGVWTFGPFSGSVGDSDLDGRIVADFVPGRPQVTATLHSQLLDLDDLAGAIGGAPGTGEGDVASAEQRAKHAALARRATLLPDAEFELDQLTQMDARLRYVAERVDTDVVPVERLRLHLTISRRGLALAPLSATVAGGTVRGQVRLTRTPDPQPPRGALQITIEDVRLGRLLAKLGTDIGASGRIDGHGAFVTSGASVAAMASSLDGGMRLSMSGGTLDALLVELAGLDLGEALLLWLGEQRKVPIRCANILAGASNGVLDFGGSVLDTTDTRFNLSGTIGFPRERLDLRLTAHPKDVSLLAARAPFIIEGRLRNPDLHPYWPALAGRAAAAAALALVTPPAALLALVEPGLGDSAPCPEGR